MTERRPELGMWVKLAAPEIIEVLAGTGIDFVVIDSEHGQLDRGAMSAMVGLARALGLKVFVRVLGHSPSELGPALDADADGLFIPHVDNAETARQVVEACRFPPVGTRPGSLATRAGKWGQRLVDDYVSRGNDEVAIIVQVESAAAVDVVAEIEAVPGLDALFVGPFDLALSTGVPPSSPELRATVARIEDMTRSLPLGGVAVTAAEALAMSDRGYSFVMVGADVSLLAGAVSGLVAGLDEAYATKEANQ